MSDSFDRLMKEAEPRRILSDGFVTKLQKAMDDVGRYSRQNPLAAAAGWSLAAVVGGIAAMLIVGRVDLIPDFVEFLLGVVGG
ncbi:MAG TPA: hypothetical protein PKV16_08740 [Caldisericia bacterium]|nr:hypothetical protein [Caldisericia bacterium]HPF49600.1 hypothetical protein [Caldisericia bacterium]HPI84484.1 hypothetical protein [Caldisericia bacterium]HPQ93850.1 hypothetical protein [Caldisericia bacterium]HRV75395.1 hypothetical protein [Caldisericia bacterium]